VYNAYAMQCTWVHNSKGCANQGTHPHSSQGKVWACLCDVHNDKLNAAIAGVDPKKLLAAWICAQGGHTRRLLT
jgi:hypothetical protein